jgi:hypothetical protein
MATALPTMAVSLVYLLWDACRRAHKRKAAPAPARMIEGDPHIEHRLDFLTILAKPLPSDR